MLCVSPIVKANFFFTHQKALGTNPMSFRAPGNDGDAFVMDIATTAVTIGKVMAVCFSGTLQRRARESQIKTLFGVSKEENNEFWKYFLFLISKKSVSFTAGIAKSRQILTLV
jgi:hypothetical protein